MRFAAVAVMLAIGGAVAKQGMLRASLPPTTDDFISLKVRAVGLTEGVEAKFKALTDHLATKRPRETSAGTSTSSAAATTVVPKLIKSTAAFTELDASAKDVSIFGASYAIPGSKDCLVAASVEGSVRDTQGVYDGKEGSVVAWFTRYPNGPKALGELPSATTSGKARLVETAKFRIIRSDCFGSGGVKKATALITKLGASVRKAKDRTAAVTYALTCLPEGIDSAVVGTEKVNVKGTSAFVASLKKPNGDKVFQVYKGLDIAKAENEIVKAFLTELGSTIDSGKEIAGVKPTKVVLKAKPATSKASTKSARL